MASILNLLVSLIAVAVYGYSIYFMNYDTNLKKMHTLIPKELVKYGQLKYLTYQCLLIQFISSLLHLGACITKSLEKPRDLFFTTLAYPIGSVVVYTFWAVWHLMGRELIFPVALSQYYPDWLNHVTHTAIVPLNLLLAIMIRHKYTKNGASIHLAYMAAYTGLLHYIKFESGVFVYQYLDIMNETQRVIHFLSLGLFAYLMYKSGQFVTSLFHAPEPSPKPVLKKKQK